MSHTTPFIVWLVWSNWRDLCTNTDCMCELSWLKKIKHWFWILWLRNDITIWSFWYQYVISYIWIKLTLSQWWCSQSVCPSLCWKTPSPPRGPAEFWLSCPSSAAPPAASSPLGPDAPASTSGSLSPPERQAPLRHRLNAGWNLPSQARPRSSPPSGGVWGLGPVSSGFGHSLTRPFSGGGLAVRCWPSERHRRAPGWGIPAAWRRRLHAVLNQRFLFN